MDDDTRRRENSFKETSRGSQHMKAESTGIRSFCVLFLTYVLSLLYSCGPPVESEWPGIARETKPWTRWWWHGSALTREGITAELEAYSKAGLGGVEITPIYGVHGYE